jgi:hypothetical protein
MNLIFTCLISITLISAFISFTQYSQAADTDSKQSPAIQNLRPKMENSAFVMSVREFSTTANTTDYLDLAISLDIINKFNNSFLEIEDPDSQLWIVTDHTRKWNCTNFYDKPLIVNSRETRNLILKFRVSKPFMSLSLLYLDKNYGNLLFPLIQVGDKSVGADIRGLSEKISMSGFEITVMSFWGTRVEDISGTTVKVRIRNTLKDLRELHMDDFFKAISTDGNVYPAQLTGDLQKTNDNPEKSDDQAQSKNQILYKFLPEIPEILNLHFMNLNPNDLQALMLKGEIGSQMIILGKKPPESIESIQTVTGVSGEARAIITQISGATREILIPDRIPENKGEMK